MDKVSRFKPAYITISLIGILVLVLLLVTSSGWAAFKDVINILLSVLFLVFLTLDIKHRSDKTRQQKIPYKYIGHIFSS